MIYTVSDYRCPKTDWVTSRIDLNVVKTAKCRENNYTTIITALEITTFISYQTQVTNLFLLW